MHASTQTKNEKVMVTCGFLSLDVNFALLAYLYIFQYLARVNEGLTCGDGRLICVHFAEFHDDLPNFVGRQNGV